MPVCFQAGFAAPCRRRHASASPDRRTKSTFDMGRIAHGAIRPQATFRPRDEIQLRHPDPTGTSNRLKIPKPVTVIVVAIGARLAATLLARGVTIHAVALNSALPSEAVMAVGCLVICPPHRNQKPGITKDTKQAVPSHRYPRCLQCRPDQTVELAGADAWLTGPIATVIPPLLAVAKSGTMLPVQVDQTFIC